jgi:hypothetical protein
MIRNRAELYGNHGRIMVEHAKSRFSSRFGRSTVLKSIQVGCQLTSGRRGSYPSEMFLEEAIDRLLREIQECRNPIGRAN